MYPRRLRRQQKWFGMPDKSFDDGYVMGRTRHETERLQKQSLLYNPSTRHLFALMGASASAYGASSSKRPAQLGTAGDRHGGRRRCRYAG
jgi:hypothetical protein